MSQKVNEETSVKLPPMDEHNEALIANVHPPDWVNPEPADRYNLVVLGAGTAGLVAAAGAAGLGAKVALVEKSLMGGDCLNVGCVPSKALIRAGRALADVRRAGAFGVDVPDGVRVDFGRVMERMRRLRAKIAPHDSAARFRDLGIDVFLGAGRFTSPDTLVVGDRSLSFKKACIATGARATGLPIDGLEEAGYLTNETVFSLTTCPKRLAVIGAGPIGCELSQAFCRFGAEVTVLEVASQALIREDADAAATVQEALEADGVRFAFDAKTQRIETGPNGEKIIRYEQNGESRQLTVDEILLSVGRAPNVTGIGLEEAGVEYDERTGVVVDDYLQTTNRRIFAAGDVCFKYKFTHVADALARIVIRNALFKGWGKASALTIPWCTYTDPEIAHVGMYEEDAEEEGLAVETFVEEFSDTDRAILDGAEEGFVKVHVRKGSDEILGATIVAPHAGEMIGELTLAIQHGIGLGQIANTIHPYPTQAMAIKATGDAYNRTRLTPFVERMFDWWLSFTR